MISHNDQNRQNIHLHCHHWLKSVRYFKIYSFGLFAEFPFSLCDQKFRNWTRTQWDIQFFHFLTIVDVLLQLLHVQFRKYNFWILNNEYTFTWSLKSLLLYGFACNCCIIFCCYWTVDSPIVLLWNHSCCMDSFENVSFYFWTMNTYLFHHWSHCCCMTMFVIIVLSSIVFEFFLIIVDASSLLLYARSQIWHFWCFENFCCSIFHFNESLTNLWTV